MNIKDLRYIVAVNEYKHFGKAAEKCYISQPTLSMQIKKLEDYLGVPLFERHNNNIMLTSVGEQVIVHAKEVLYHVDNLISIARESSDPKAGELKIGSIPTIGPYLFPKIMPSLKEKYPKLKYFLHEDSTDNIMHRLRDGELDLAILATPINENSLKKEVVLEEEIYLAVSKEHDLDRKKKINPDDLSNVDLLLLPDGHYLNTQEIDVSSLANAKELIQFNVTSLETLKEMVSVNTGVTLLPDLASKNLSQNNIEIKQFESPVPKREIAFFWRGSNYRNDLIHEMALEIKKII